MRLRFFFCVIQIPKGLSESVNRRKTDNAMAKRQKDKQRSTKAYRSQKKINTFSSVAITLNKNHLRYHKHKCPLHGIQSLSHGVEIKCVITLEVEQTTDKVSGS
jgi:ribosomal protein L44E